MRQDKLVLMDRGAGGDTCFAKLNWLHGKMDQVHARLHLLPVVET